MSKSRGTWRKASQTARDETTDTETLCRASAFSASVSHLTGGLNASGRHGERIIWFMNNSRGKIDNKRKKQKDSYHSRCEKLKGQRCLAMETNSKIANVINRITNGHILH